MIKGFRASGVSPHMFTNQHEIGQLAPGERKGLTRLFQRTPRSHLHLDWRGLESWAAHPDMRCWVSRENGRIRSLAGATIHGNAGDPDLRLAWLRFIINPSAMGISSDLPLLFHNLREELEEEGVSQIAVLTIDPWVENMAKVWGFEQENAIITLQRTNGDVSLPSPDQPRIRAAREADLDEVAKLDARAFAPLWHYDRPILEYAMLQSASFTVIENETGILGYQLSSSGLTKGHLARLAVDPVCQGHGYGRILTEDMIRALRRRGLSVITVNTQEDNIKSQKLYEALGFRIYGRKYPVWVLDL